MSKTDNRPSHRVYAVTKNGERSFWQPIGAAWVHSDSWGFNVKIEYLPLNGADSSFASRRLKKPTYRQAKRPDPSGPPSGGPFPRTMNKGFVRARCNRPIIICGRSAATTGGLLTHLAHCKCRIEYDVFRGAGRAYRV